MHILIVEDEAGIVQFLQQGLEEIEQFPLHPPRLICA